MRESYSPAWCPHVVGEYDPPDEDGQRFRARCTRCGAEWRGVCTSGRVRTRIATFATVHSDCPTRPREGA